MPIENTSAIAKEAAETSNSGKENIIKCAKEFGLTPESSREQAEHVRNTGRKEWLAAAKKMEGVRKDIAFETDPVKKEALNEKLEDIKHNELFPAGHKQTTAEAMLNILK